MEAKLRIHLAWRVDFGGLYSPYTMLVNIPSSAKISLLPACGKQVKLLTQDASLVDCLACKRRAKYQT